MVLQTQFADIKGNDLYIDGIKASDLAKQYGTPLYVMSEGHIRHQMKELTAYLQEKSVSHYVLDLIQIRSTSMETISFLQKLNMH